MPDLLWVGIHLWLVTVTNKLLWTQQQEVNMVPSSMFPLRNIPLKVPAHAQPVFIMYLQVPRQPGHNQQLPGSHVVDLDNLPHHRLWGYGPKHVLWEGSLPPDRHHGESGVDA